jgi:hypothetical protein
MEGETVAVVVMGLLVPAEYEYGNLALQVVR